MVVSEACVLMPRWRRDHQRITTSDAALNRPAATGSAGAKVVASEDARIAVSAPREGVAEGGTAPPDPGSAVGEKPVDSGLSVASGDGDASETPLERVGEDIASGPDDHTTSTLDELRYPDDTALSDSERKARNVQLSPVAESTDWHVLPELHDFTFSPVVMFIMTT